MWNRSIRFLREESAGQDKDGFRQQEEFQTGSIPASFMDVTRNDEILASQKGYTADQNIEVMACNYSGEERLLDEADGTVYEVKRTYQKDKSMAVILTCERREHGEI